MYCDPYSPRFGVVNKAEVEVFMNAPAFFNDPMDIGNLISGFSAFSKPSLYISEVLSSLTAEA